MSQRGLITLPCCSFLEVEGFSPGRFPERLLDLT